MSKAEGLIDEQHRYVAQQGFTMKNGRDAANPLGHVTVDASAVGSTGCAHVKTFGPHGRCGRFDAFEGCREIVHHLVHPGYDNDFPGTESHRVGAVADSVDIDDFTGDGDGVGAA